MAVFCTAFSAPAWANGNDYVAAVKQQLKDQGYKITETTKTFLGRVRFEAKRDTVRREIVINPRTGEILRDLNRTITGAVVVVVPVEKPELPKAAVIDENPETPENVTGDDANSTENTGSDVAGSDVGSESGSDAGSGDAGSSGSSDGSSDSGSGDAGSSGSGDGSGGDGGDGGSGGD